MKRSVPMARSGKLKSAHWSSQDDYRFGNQSPGKWQKKQSLFSLGNRMLRLYSPWQGFSPPITAGLRISSWSLFLLAPLLIVSSLVWPTAYDIFMRSLSQPASLSLFFFFSSLFPSYLLSRVKVIPSYMACFQRIVTFISSQYFKNPC